MERSTGKSRKSSLKDGKQENPVVTAKTTSNGSFAVARPYARRSTTSTATQRLAKHVISCAQHNRSPLD